MTFRVRNFVWKGLGCLLFVPSAAFGFDKSLSAEHGMVASSNGIASAVGVEILKKGGNAIDAACAVGFALAVVHPAAGNLGGGGFMLVRLANGRSVAIDYRETAPLAASRDMYLDARGKVIDGSSLTGYRASGVPGTVAGLALAHSKYGKLPWKVVVQPAIQLAAEGFVLSKSLAGEFRSAPNLGLFAESRKVFQRDGNYYQAGDLFRQPELAETLRRIAVGGRDGFYRGRTAQLIVDGMMDGGLITLNDLANFRPVIRKPLTGTYRGYGVITMPPPSSGGIALLEMLNMLERYDLRRFGAQSPETDHLLIESMRRAFADRAAFLGDPDFIRVPVKGLIDKGYAARVGASIKPAQASTSKEVGHGNPVGYESAETTHFSVVDREGNAVSNTYTLNFSFGSGVTVPGAGFLMNDEMDDFTSKVGEPNGFGLIQGVGNAIAPGKRPLSSMTPTIVTKGGKLFLVVGSPGGPTIITTVLQVISNIVDHGMGVADAVGAKRLHQQWLPDEVRFETGALSGSVSGPVSGSIRSLLEAAGYVLRESKKWGDAEVIEVDPRTHLRTGASDPRSGDSGVAGY